MNAFQSKFSTRQVLAAAGVSNDNLQNWLRRGLVIGQEKIGGGGGQGHHRQFSFFNVIEIAAAKALIDAGMGNLEAVFYAANLFAHTGEDGRIPGCPFNTAPGYTLLVAWPDGANVLFLSPKDGALALYTTLVSNNRIGATFANVSRVFDDVCGRLMEITGSKEFHPEAVMEFAYSTGAEA